MKEKRKRRQIYETFNLETQTKLSIYNLIQYFELNENYKV